MKSRFHKIIAMPALLAFSTLYLTFSTAQAQSSTAFTYQGLLQHNGTNAGPVCLEFALYTSSGTLIVGPEPATGGNPVPVTNGFFTVILDFGSYPFTDCPQQSYLLETFSSTNCSATNSFTNLVAITPVTPTPLAINAEYACVAQTANTATYATSAASAASATSASYATNAGTATWAINSIMAIYATNAGSATSLGNGQALGAGASNSLGSGDLDSFIGGGAFNTIQTGNNYSIISGGDNNTIQTTANESFIGGGTSNSILNSAADSAIAGGFYNTIEANAGYSFIGGGVRNQTYSGWSVISGGNGNYVSNNTVGSTIGGGWSNTNGANYATVSGGESNLAAGAFATVPGGYDNGAVGSYSFAAGHGATARFDGSFVWSDSAGTFADSGPNQFNVSSSGGVVFNAGSAPFNVNSGGGFSVGAGSSVINLSTSGFMDVEAGTVVVTGGAGTGLVLNGTFLVNNVPQSIGFFAEAGNSGDTPQGEYIISGDSGWNSQCDRNVKTNFAAVDNRQILERLAAIPITTWRYKSQTNNALRHLGPMAQDFYAAFEVGADDKHINNLDEEGVALAAIQGLNQKLDQQLKEKDAAIQDLKGRLEQLEKIVSNLPNQH